MNQKNIPEEAINEVAKVINERNNKQSTIPIITIDDNSETPHYYEIIPFDEIDNTSRKFFAIDGSYNSQEFYNGLSIGIYTAGYVCYEHGKQIKLNNNNDPMINGKGYFPNNILVTNDDHLFEIYNELMALEPVSKLLEFFGDDISKVFSFSEELICSSLSKLLSFCQEILEWALVFEISNLSIIKSNDYILRDGTLRSNNIKQEYLTKLGKHLKTKEIVLISVTKNSPIKLELSATFKKIDNYLQDQLKPQYPFKTTNPKWKKLCCWLEVPDDILVFAYPEASQRKEYQKGKIDKITKTSMFAKKDLSGGRGFGIFFVARLDYVEKLQNYDWVVVDLNIFDVMPYIESNKKIRDIVKIEEIFFELTRLTQEHYILGYPYPLVEAHNFVTLKKDFKEEIIKRVKYSLYKEQMMDHIDIENLFLDIHDRF